MHDIQEFCEKYGWNGALLYAGILPGIGLISVITYAFMKNPLTCMAFCMYIGASFWLFSKFATWVRKQT